MASTPPTDQAFLREVDEELRKDELQSLWKRYGRLGVATIVLIIAAWGGWLYWQHRQTEASGLEGEKLSRAVNDLQGGNTDAATATLKELSKSGNDGYKATAKLGEGAIAVQKGDMKTAAARFAEVAADTSLDQPWRDLALIRQTAVEFDTLKPGEVVARLQPLAVKGNPWFGSAGEMVAADYLKMNKPALAGKIYGEIGKDEGVPETIRSRAVQMASALGVDAVTLPSKDAE